MGTRAFGAGIAGSAAILGTGLIVFSLPMSRVFLTDALEAGSAIGVARQGQVTWAVIAGALAYSGLITAFIAARGRRTGVGAGAGIGAAVGLALWYTADLMLYALTNVSDLPAMLLAPLVECVPGAVAGALIAGLLHKTWAPAPQQVHRPAL